MVLKTHFSVFLKSLISIGVIGMVLDYVLLEIKLVLKEGDDPLANVQLKRQNSI